MARRPLNICEDCKYTWHPKGHNLSKVCPNCGSANIRIYTNKFILLVLLHLFIFFFVIYLRTDINLSDIILALKAKNGWLKPPPFDPDAYLSKVKSIFLWTASVYLIAILIFIRKIFKGASKAEIEVSPNQSDVTLLVTTSSQKLQSTKQAGSIDAKFKWDVFISHAHEDKNEFVRPLASALMKKGLKIWFDDFTVKVGDSLRRSIDRGLANSKYGIVIISPNFLQKDWPQRELDALASLEVKGRKVILPIWHNVDLEEVKRYSPMLADRVAVLSHIGIDNVVAALLEAMNRRDI